MYRPAYTYRGSPIIPGGRGSYRPGGRKTPPSPWKVIVLLLLIIGLITLCWWWPASSSDSQNVEEVMKTTRQTVVPVKKQEAVRKVAATEPQQTIPTLTQDASQEVSLEQQQICRSAETLLKQRKYEEARQALASLLNDISTETQFYQHVIKLLNLSADGLLSDNQFVPPYTKYTVKSGDNLTVIARKHKTSIDRIIEASELPNANRLSIGMELKIPTNTWSAKIYLTSKRVMIYESDRLIKVYQLHFTHTPRLRYAQYTMTQRDSLWQQLQLNSSDIKDIRKFLPIGTTILIENDK